MIKDNLKNSTLYISANKNFDKAFDFIKKAVNENYPAGSYVIDGKEVYAFIQEYTSKLSTESQYEGHKNYVDIQFIISGEEVIQVSDINFCKIKTEYNGESDIAFYHDALNPTTCILNSGEYVILFPHDLHKPGMAVDGNQQPVKKLVVKVKNV